MQCCTNVTYCQFPPYTQFNTINMLTPFDKSLLCFQSDVQTNTLNSILYQEIDYVDDMNQINIISHSHSSYYDVDTFSTLANKTNH